MTSFFPDINSKQIIKIIEKLGYELIRQSGTSHAVYRRASDGRRTTIPVHGKKSQKEELSNQFAKMLELTLSN